MAAARIRNTGAKKLFRKDLRFPKTSLRNKYNCAPMHSVLAMAFTRKAAYPRVIRIDHSALVAADISLRKLTQAGPL